MAVEIQIIEGIINVVSDKTITFIFEGYVVCTEGMLFTSRSNSACINFTLSLLVVPDPSATALLLYVGNSTYVFVFGRIFHYTMDSHPDGKGK
jgi:hypothetical protein